jgi:membrane protein YdbS with pleckstrin-like domain
MGYYFAVWGIVTLFTIVMSLLVIWIFITPARVAQWSAKIPEFSVTIQE